MRVRELGEQEAGFTRWSVPGVYPGYLTDTVIT